MKTISSKIKLITSYIICITVFFILSLYFYKLLIITNPYYLLIIIPILFLSIVSFLFNTLKLVMTIISILFGKNDNEEVPIFVNKFIYSINQLYKYILIGIFIALITSIMILDILLCINYEKKLLMIISLLIWLVVYYLIFSVILKIVNSQAQYF